MLDAYNRFLDPIVFGRYPAEMTSILGSTLPKFSENDLEDLKMGLDFIGINHYTSLYVQDCLYSPCEFSTGASRTEGFAKTTDSKNGIPIGEPVSHSHTYVINTKASNQSSMISGLILVSADRGKP